MKDKQFGNIKWNADFGYWEGAVPIDYFARLGQEPYVTEEIYEEVSTGRFAIQIETADVRRAPLPSQRQAWQSFMEAMPALGDEMVRSFWAEYQLQRPARVKWWKAIYDDAHYGDVLPEATSPDEMKKLVRPYFVRLPAPGKTKPVAEIGIMFQCCWNAEGCAALVNDGGLSFVDVAGRVMSPNLSSKLTHSTFGSLHRFREDEFWIGTVRLEPFRAFHSVAQERAAYRENPERVGPPQSKLGWQFARGNFPLWVHAHPDEAPSEVQSRAWKEFTVDEARNCETMLNAVYEDYLRTREQRQAACQGREPYIEAALPEIESADGLHEIMNLREVNVLPERVDGGATVSLVFSIAGGAVGVRWHGGEVVGLARKDGTAIEESLRLRKP